MTRSRLIPFSVVAVALACVALAAGTAQARIVSIGLQTAGLDYGDAFTFVDGDLQVVATATGLDGSAKDVLATPWGLGVWDGSGVPLLDGVNDGEVLWLNFSHAVKLTDIAFNLVDPSGDDLRLIDADGNVLLDIQLSPGSDKGSKWITLSQVMAEGDNQRLAQIGITTQGVESDWLVKRVIVSAPLPAAAASGLGLLVVAGIVRLRRRFRRVK